MKRYFKCLESGASASLLEHRNGTATLRIYNSGKKYIKDYNTVRGARIAMGRYSGWWEEVK